MNYMVVLIIYMVYKLQNWVQREIQRHFSSNKEVILRTLNQSRNSKLKYKRINRIKVVLVNKRKY
jgi:hypothetical protein